MTDFSAITSASHRYNLHCHTQFCDGYSLMEDFVRRAIDEGFTHLGFTPHSVVPIESPCNIRRCDVQPYFDEVARLREEYGRYLIIYAAMEIDYLGSDWGPSHPYFDTLPLDYRIGSVHFVPTREGELVDMDGRPERFAERLAKHFGGDLRYVVETYFDQSMKMVEAGGFHIIGHFDKISNNASHVKPDVEDEPWYRERIDELIESIIDHRLTVEINTKQWLEFKRFSPSARYFSRLKQAAIPLVVNSDSHHAHLINAGRDEALRLLNDA